MKKASKEDLQKILDSVIAQKGITFIRDGLVKYSGIKYPKKLGMMIEPDGDGYRYTVLLDGTQADRIAMIYFEDHKLKKGSTWFDMKLAASFGFCAVYRSILGNICVMPDDNGFNILQDKFVNLMNNQELAFSFLKVLVPLDKYPEVD